MNRDNFIALMEDKTKRRNQQGLLISSVINDDQLIILLIKKMASDSEHASFYARILELACKRDLTVILTHLAPFCDGLSRLTLDGCCRSSAKICELLMIAYAIKKDISVYAHLNKRHQEKLIETCFDWKINNRATAIQAHSMYALYLLGLEHTWIHPDLILLIEKNLPKGSTGYKNRGRKIIKAIETNTIYKL